MSVVGDEVGMIRGVRIAGPGREYLIDEEPVDIVIADGRIADIAPAGALRPTGAVLDAEGAWAVPGLWDNHVHTVQWALAAERESLDDTLGRRGGVPDGGGRASVGRAARGNGVSRRALGRPPDARRVGRGDR